VQTLVVALLSRPQCAANVRDCWARQSIPSTLVVLENGDGRGACKSINFTPYILIEGPANLVELRNMGLEVARVLKAGMLAFFDDDDYYGAGYLAEAVQALELVGFVGKPNRFVHAGERLWLLDGLPPGPVAASTLVVRTGAAMPFRRGSVSWGEDTQWCTDMLAAGRTMAVTGPHHFAYTRGDPVGHAWPIATDAFIRSWISAGGQARDLGPWNPGIVDGLVPIPVGRELDFGEWRPEDDPSVAAAMRELGWT
jgi:hypothetical protein